MRVATYTEPGAPTRGSFLALGILTLTILLGTGVIPTLAGFVGGPIERTLTPLWLLLYLCGVLGLMFTHGINWISWLVRYRILLVLLMLGTIMSVSWSIDAKVSAERTVHLMGSTLIAVYIGFTVPLLTTLRVFAIILALTMLASVGSAIVLPELGIQAYEGSQVWRGVFNSKNDLGFWAATGVLLYVTLSDSTQTTSRKLACFVMAGICLGILALSQSATSLLAMLVAGSLSLYLFIASRFQLGFIRMTFVALMLCGLLALAIINIETAELVGRTDDLTGRGEVWRQTWSLIIERPLTGYGYGSLWFPNDATIAIQQSLMDFTWVVHHAHNGLLQVASEVGMPLALVAILMVAQQLIEIFYCQYERQQVGVLFVLAFATAFLISNFSEARFLVTRELFWIFFLALPISMLRQINVVSSELINGPVSDDHSDARADWSESYAPAQGPVPGKPWLDSLPQARQSTASAGLGGAALLAHQPGVENPAGYSDTYADGESTFSQAVDELDVDLATSTLSLDETDINLGEPDEELLAMNRSSHDDTLDLTESESLDEASVVSEKPVVGENQEAGKPESTIDHDDLRYNDTLDVDRYDKDLDIDHTGEWIDIPLDDDR